MGLFFTPVLKALIKCMRFFEFLVVVVVSCKSLWLCYYNATMKKSLRQILVLFSFWASFSLASSLYAGIKSCNEQEVNFDFLKKDLPKFQKNVKNIEKESWDVNSGSSFSISSCLTGKQGDFPFFSRKSLSLNFFQREILKKPFLFVASGLSPPFFLI